MWLLQPYLHNFTADDDDDGDDDLLLTLKIVYYFDITCLDRFCMSCLSHFCSFYKTVGACEREMVSSPIST